MFIFKKTLKLRLNHFLNFRIHMIFLKIIFFNIIFYKFVTYLILALNGRQIKSY